MLDGCARFLVHKPPGVIDAAVRSIIRSAYTYVPRVHLALDEAGVDPGSVRGRGDLHRLPMLSRATFLDRPTSEYTHRDADLSRSYRSSTSGSTNEPLNVYMSPAEAAYRKLVLLEALHKNTRFRLPLRIAEVGTGQIGMKTRRPLHRLDLVRVFHVPRILPAEEQLELLIQARPHIITGHPSCLELVAEKVAPRSSALSPRLVVCRGERLRDESRVLLEESFGCRVMDYYNCDEIGNIAWECPEYPRRLHISTDGCVVEVVNERGDPLPAETEGLVVVTNLFNRTMPFIRHRLGDRGSLLGGEDSRCSCGHRGPSLALLQGREDDYCLLPDGRRLSPRVLDSIVGLAVEAPEGKGYYARQFQCIQETQESFRVLLRPVSNAPDDLPTRVSRAIEGLDPRITCRVEFVTEFPPTPSGKHRSIVPRR